MRIQRQWMMSFAFMFVFLLCVGVSAFAQEPPQGTGIRVPAPPGEDTVFFISSEMSFDGKVVKGAPYSAQAITETTRTLGDGNKIKNKTTASIYRDGEGRTRREQELGAVGPWAVSGEPQQTVFINDPVTGVNYILDPRLLSPGGGTLLSDPSITVRWRNITVEDALRRVLLDVADLLGEGGHQRLVDVEVLGLHRRRQDDVGVLDGIGRELLHHDGEQVLALEPAAHPARARVARHRVGSCVAWSCVLLGVGRLGSPPKSSRRFSALCRKRQVPAARTSCAGYRC